MDNKQRVRLQYNANVIYGNRVTRQPTEKAGSVKFNLDCRQLAGPVESALRQRSG